MPLSNQRSIEMADHTGDVYGLYGSRRAKKAVVRDIDRAVRYEILPNAKFLGGEIYVTKDQSIAADDTFTLTVVAG